MLECAAPDLFPVDPLGIQEMSESDFVGLGRSIYSPEQIEQFNLFQEIAGARAAFLAVQTGTAYKGKNAAGDWGLPFGSYQQEQLIDTMGMSFIPLYRFFGPMSMSVLMILFVVGIVRITITVVVRAVILVRARGCGPWVLGSLYGAFFQFFLTPFAWADSLATGVAQRMDQEMVNRAENPELPGRVFLDLAQAQKTKEGWAGALRILKGIPKEDVEPRAPEQSPMVPRV